jgi:hypothetical protein
MIPNPNILRNCDMIQKKLNDIDKSLFRLYRSMVVSGSAHNETDETIIDNILQLEASVGRVYFPQHTKQAKLEVNCPPIQIRSAEFYYSMHSIKEYHEKLDSERRVDNYLHSVGYPHTTNWAETFKIVSPVCLNVYDLNIVIYARVASHWRYTLRVVYSAKRSSFLLKETISRSPSTGQYSSYLPINDYYMLPGSIDSPATRELIQCLLARGGIELNPGPNVAVKSKVRRRRNRKNVKGRSEMSLRKKAGTTITHANERRYIADTTRWIGEYVDLSTRNNVGANALSWRYRGNSAYDPDPALFSGSLSGYSEFASLYTRYLCDTLNYEISFKNNENFEVTCSVFYSAYDLGINIPRPVELSNMEQYSKMCVLNPVGDPKSESKLSGLLSGKKVIGHNYIYSDETYASAVTTNPSKLWFLNLCATPTEPTNVFVHGLTMNVKVGFRVHFFAQNRNPQDSGSMMNHKGSRAVEILPPPKVNPSDEEYFPGSEGWKPNFQNVYRIVDVRQVIADQKKKISDQEDELSILARQLSKTKI